jgi:hypothetical protein
VLADLASTTPAVQVQVEPLLALVRTHVAQARAARIAALASLEASSTDTSLQIAASGERRAATESLVSIRALAAQVPPDEASSSVVQIDTEEAVSAGDSNLAAGHFKAAFSAFQSAVRAATEARVTAQAQSNLGTQVTLASVIPTDTTLATSSATSTLSGQAARSATTSLNSGN